MYLAGVGRLRCCTWEAGAPVGRGLFFVGMTGSSGDNCVWRSGSHVRSGGSTHMGTGPRPLLIVLFRTIPLLPPTPNAHECATPTIRHTEATRTPAEPPHDHPTHLTRPPTPKTTPPETTTPHTRTRPRCPHTPQPQHKTEPISTRVATDLEPEADRSRRGVRPISSRNRTDLKPEPDRSRRGLARGAGCGRAPASISSEASREPVRRRPRRSSGRAGRCPYAAPPCGRPRRSHR